jgi:Flp pilus assembly protein TadG
VSPTRRTAAGTDAGTTTIELVILTPVVLALLCFVVGLGRIADARGQLTGAARDAARAASLASTPAAAQRAAAQTARADLADAGIDCEDMTVGVDTAAFTPGGQVSVQLACTTDLSAVVVAGLPGHATFRTSAVVPLTRYTQIGSGS